MPLFELSDERLAECKPVTFAHLEIKEREVIQRVLRDDIKVLGADLLVISEQSGNWEDARRRIDLLALDKRGRLVVIELTRTETDAHMDLEVANLTGKPLLHVMRPTSQGEPRSGALSCVIACGA